MGRIQPFCLCAYVHTCSHVPLPTLGFCLLCFLGSGVDYPSDCSSWLQRLGLAKSKVGRNSSSGPDKTPSFRCPDAVNSAGGEPLLFFDSTWVSQPHWTDMNPEKENGKIERVWWKASDVSLFGSGKCRNQSWIWMSWDFLETGKEICERDRFCSLMVVFFSVYFSPQLGRLSGLFFSHKFWSLSFFECLFVP